MRIRHREHFALSREQEPGTFLVNGHVLLTTTNNGSKGNCQPSWDAEHILGTKPRASAASAPFTPTANIGWQADLHQHFTDEVTGVQRKEAAGPRSPASLDHRSLGSSSDDNVGQGTDKKTNHRRDYLSHIPSCGLPAMPHSTSYSLGGYCGSSFVSGKEESSMRSSCQLTAP